MHRVEKEEAVLRDELFMCFCIKNYIGTRGEDLSTVAFCLVFSSSWYPGLAAACGCGTPWICDLTIYCQCHCFLSVPDFLFACLG